VDADAVIQVLQPVAKDVVNAIGTLIKTKKAFDNSGGDVAVLQLLGDLRFDTINFQQVLNEIILVCNLIVAMLDRSLTNIYHAFSPTRNRQAEVSDALESAQEIYGEGNS